ncbi:MAG: cyclase family protein [Deltaproteobacteria bacterium]|nr:cyclase family protein [Deltaproteobacteria bacterium]
MPRIIDLSLTVDTSTMGPPSTNVRLGLERFHRGPGFWQVSSVHASVHTGSHIDSPLHVFADGKTTAELPLERVIGEAVVVDLTHVQANQAISVEDLRKGGAEQVRSGDIVLLHTGWTDRMFGQFPRFFTESPYFPAESAEWLVARGPKAIGFDFFEEYAARLKDFTSEDFPMHRAILGKGVVIMEGLTNLGALPSRRVQFFAPFFKLGETEGAPARFFALVD